MVLGCVVNFGVCCQFFLPAAGPLPGVALSGEQPPAARCAGLLARKKKHIFFYFFLFVAGTDSLIREISEG